MAPTRRSKPQQARGVSRGAGRFLRLPPTERHGSQSLPQPHGDGPDGHSAFPPRDGSAGRANPCRSPLRHPAVTDPSLALLGVVHRCPPEALCPPVRPAEPRGAKPEPSGVRRRSQVLSSCSFVGKFYGNLWELAFILGRRRASDNGGVGHTPATLPLKGQSDY